MIHTLLRSTLGLAVAAAATLVIVAGSAAPAAAAETPRTAIVDIRGIDLTSAAGQAQVHSAIKVAARRVCTTTESQTLAVLLANRDCVATAVAGAVVPRAVMADAAPTITVGK